MDSFAKFGAGWVADRRRGSMIVSIVLSFILFILSCVCMGGDTTNTDNLQRGGSWALGVKNDKTYFYFGLKKVFSKVNGVSMGIYYDDNNCSSDFCDDCSSAGITAFNSSVLVFMLSFVLMFMSYVRMSTERDTPIRKALTAGVCVVELLTIIIAMGTFNDQCMDQLKNYAGFDTYDINPGPGIQAAGAAFVFTLFISFLQFALPTTGGSEDSYANFN